MNKGFFKFAILRINPGPRPNTHGLSIDQAFDMIFNHTNLRNLDKLPFDAKAMIKDKLYVYITDIKKAFILIYRRMISVIYQETCMIVGKKA